MKTKNQGPRGVDTTLNVSERVGNTQPGLRNHPGTKTSDEEILKILHKDILLEFPDLKLDFTGNGYNYSMSDVKKAIALKDEACDEDIDNAFIRGQKAERKRTLEIIDKKISDFRSNPAIATYMVPHLEELKKEVLEK